MAWRRKMSASAGSGLTAMSSRPATEAASSGSRSPNRSSVGRVVPGSWRTRLRIRPAAGRSRHARSSGTAAVVRAASRGSDVEASLRQGGPIVIGLGRMAKRTVGRSIGFPSVSRHTPTVADPTSIGRTHRTTMGPGHGTPAEGTARRSAGPGRVSAAAHHPHAAFRAVERAGALRLEAAVGADHAREAGLRGARPVRGAEAVARRMTC